MFPCTSVFRKIAKKLLICFQLRLRAFDILAILSSQDESRSISENSTWGIRRKYEQGKVSVNYTKFLGYDKGEDGNLVINEKQVKIVRRIYKDYLDGKSANRIARELEEEIRSTL